MKNLYQELTKDFEKNQGSVFYYFSPNLTDLQQ